MIFQISPELSVCPRPKRKTVRAINIKHGIYIVHGWSSPCIDPEVNRLKVKLTRGYEMRAAVVVLQVDMTALVSS